VTAVARPRAEIVALLRDIGLIPVIRCDSADVAVRVTDALCDAGLRVVEITMTVPNALDAISRIARRARDGGSTYRVVVGAGTVTEARDVQRAVDAGAEFIVSPCLVSDVVAAAKAAGVAVIPGGLTPTEILAAQRMGADLVKVFPAQAVGGASYIRALRGPFPDLPLVATGGVDLNNVGDFIRAGAAAVGVGSELMSRDDLARGNYDGIATRAREFMTAIAAARREPKRAERARV
jgi:2-dehydro-3-deoxyphosphogluconate aldolase / (4S)-4-hydroxy-2-oxoglutarate aldolase